MRYEVPVIPIVNSCTVRISPLVVGGTRLKQKVPDALGIPVVAYALLTRVKVETRLLGEGTVTALL